MVSDAVPMSSAERAQAHHGRGKSRLNVSSPMPDADRLLPTGGLRSARIAVTGGAGFIGSHVVDRLQSAGADVMVIDNLSTGCIDNLAEAFARGLAADDLVVCDVRSDDCANTIRRWKPRAVVHLAGQPSLPASIDSPLLDADINIRGTLNVFDACAEAGVEIVVYAASSAIYGQVSADRLPVTEHTPIAPTSPYGLSKATALLYLDWYRQHRDLSYTAIALGNVYGPRQSGQGRGVIARMAGEVVSGGAPLITGDGHQTRDFVHVTDVATAVVLACRSVNVGMVNVASGVETSIIEIFNRVCSATGKEVTPRFAPSVSGEAHRIILDINRARAVLGWHPIVPLTEGIRMTVRDAAQRSSLETAS